MAAHRSRFVKGGEDDGGNVNASVAIAYPPPHPPDLHHRLMLLLHNTSSAPSPFCPPPSPSPSTLDRQRRRRAERTRMARRRRQTSLVEISSNSDLASHRDRVRGTLRWLFQLDQDFPHTLSNSNLNSHSSLLLNNITASLARSSSSPSSSTHDQTLREEYNPNSAMKESDCMDNKSLSHNYIEADKEEDKKKEKKKEKRKEKEKKKEETSRSEFRHRLGHYSQVILSSSSSSSSSSVLNISREAEEWGRDEWQFQAEILMAECNLLVVEKELAERRWQQSCVTMDQAVRVAEALEAKLFSLQEQGRRNPTKGRCRNPFLNDSDNLLLQRLSQDRVERSLCEKAYDQQDSSKSGAIVPTGEEVFPKSDKVMSPCGGDGRAVEALQEKLQNLLLFPGLSSSASSSTTGSQIGSAQKASTASDFMQEDANKGILQRSSIANQRCMVETAALRKQLDYLSTELEETEEIAAFIRQEYRSMLSSSAELKSAKTRCSAKFNRGDLCEEVQRREALKNIAAHVQTETEQWSQVQDILHHIHQEMEDLRKAHDIWEERALHAEAQLMSLQEGVQRWSLRAQIAEEEVAMLRSKAEALKNEVEKVKQRHAMEQSKWLTDNVIFTTSNSSNTISSTDTKTHKNNSKATNKGPGEAALNNVRAFSPFSLPMISSSISNGELTSSPKSFHHLSDLVVDQNGSNSILSSRTRTRIGDQDRDYNPKVVTRQQRTAVNKVRRKYNMQTINDLHGESVHVEHPINESINTNESKKLTSNNSIISEDVVMGGARRSFSNPCKENRTKKSRCSNNYVHGEMHNFPLQLEDQEGLLTTQTKNRIINGNQFQHNNNNINNNNNNNSNSSNTVLAKGSPSSAVSGSSRPPLGEIPFNQYRGFLY